MKHARLIWTGLTVIVVVGTAALALAGNKASKSAAASLAATPATCSAEMAARCTPEMAAACGAKGSGTAATGAAGCPMHGTAATTASTDCGMHGAKASAAAAGCCSKGAKGAKASGAMSAAPTGGPACGAHGGASAAAMDCDACTDMMSCAADIAEAGGKVQIVPLKNGLMYVYSAESSAKVRAVQAAVARHTERVAAMGTAGDKSRLCTDCREMRGAVASGKLTREVVNIESGCLTLVTSNDSRVVARLYAMAGVQSGVARANTKS